MHQWWRLWYLLELTISFLSVFFSQCPFFNSFIKTSDSLLSQSLKLVSQLIIISLVSQTPLRMEWKLRHSSLECTQHIKVYMQFQGFLSVFKLIHVTSKSSCPSVNFSLNKYLLNSSSVSFNFIPSIIFSFLIPVFVCHFRFTNPFSVCYLFWFTQCCELSHLQSLNLLKTFYYGNFQRYMKREGKV